MTYAYCCPQPAAEEACPSHEKPADGCDLAQGKAVKPELSQWEVLRKILPAAGGSFIEWYEFAIYSYLTSYITANFFADGRGGSLGTWAGFAVTFAFRPIGGLAFGCLADRFGRKPAMQLTIVLMLVTTVLQGCLPTFRCCGEGWGWFGLLLLLVLRALQGLSAGGELSTAAVYIGEVSPKKSLGLNLSWISVTGAFGAWTVAALVVALMESCLTKEEMYSWGWRLPYVTSIIPGMLLVLCRRFLEETSDFEELLQAEVQNKSTADLEEGSEEHSAASQTSVAQRRRSPVAELLANHKLPLVIAALGTCGIGALWFVPPIYGVSFIQQYSGLPAAAATWSQMVCFLLPTLLAPVAGMFIDCWGVGKVYALSVVLGALVAPGPLFYWWAHVPQNQAVAAVFVGQVLLGLIQALTTATYLWVVELFPVHVRGTGVALSYNVGVGICGGLGPLLSDAGNMVISPRGPVSAPAAFTIFTGLVSVSAIAASHVLQRKGMMRLTHLRDAPY